MIDMNISLNAVLIQDEIIGGFTAYFKEFPDILAVGDNEDLAIINLINAFHDVLKYKSESKTSLPGKKSNYITERSINFKSFEQAPA